MQIRVRICSCKIEILAPAFRVKTVLGRNGLEQRRFAGAILPDEEGDRRMKLSPFRCRTAGIEKGYSSKLFMDSLSRRIACKKVFLMIGSIFLLLGRPI